MYNFDQFICVIKLHSHADLMNWVTHCPESPSRASSSPLQCRCVLISSHTLVIITGISLTQTSPLVPWNRRVDCKCFFYQSWQPDVTFQQPADQTTWRVRPCSGPSLPLESALMPTFIGIKNKEHVIQYERIIVATT